MFSLFSGCSKNEAVNTTPAEGKEIQKEAEQVEKTEPVKITFLILRQK